MRSIQAYRNQLYEKTIASILRRTFSSLFLAFILLAFTGCLLTGSGSDTPYPGTAGSGAVAQEWYGVYFTQPDSPEARFYRGGPADILAEAIGNACISVDMAAYRFNLWAIRDALLDAKARGVTVRVVVDNENAGEPELQELVEAGIEVVSDRSDSLMHNKFFIIDRMEVYTGSMNPTVGGAYHDRNNVIRVRNARLAEAYTVEFEEMFVYKIFSRASPVSNGNPQVNVQGTLIEAFYSPEDETASRIIDLLHGAQESIYFLAFSFTADDIAGAMIDRAQAGLHVAGVMERTQYNSNQGTEFDRLRAAGIDVLLDSDPDNMHHKVIIIDEGIVVTGSYNFSRSAEQTNDENVLIVHNGEVAGYYLEEFNRIHELARE